MASKQPYGTIVAFVLQGPASSGKTTAIKAFKSDPRLQDYERLETGYRRNVHRFHFRAMRSDNGVSIPLWLDLIELQDTDTFNTNDVDGIIILKRTSIKRALPPIETTRPGSKLFKMKEWDNLDTVPFDSASFTSAIEALLAEYGIFLLGSRSSATKELHVLLVGKDSLVPEKRDLFANLPTTLSANGKEVMFNYHQYNDVTLEVESRFASSTRLQPKFSKKSAFACADAIILCADFQVDFAESLYFAMSDAFEALYDNRVFDVRLFLWGLEHDDDESDCGRLLPQYKDRFARIIRQDPGDERKVAPTVASILLDDPSLLVMNNDTKTEQWNELMTIIQKLKEENKGLATSNLQLTARLEEHKVQTEQLEKYRRDLEHLEKEFETERDNHLAARMQLQEIHQQHDEIFAVVEGLKNQVINKNASVKNQEE